MWYLIKDSGDKVIYVVGKNTEVIVGRNADSETFRFVIPDDPSISRKHAILSLVNSELFLKDLGSRYGTFINDNNDKIESKTLIKLNNGDIVKFGKMNSVFTVHHKSFVTCTSTLKGENLINLRECLNNLSATLKNDWDENCLFLTMPAITLTLKVVLALVQGAHIVTVNFWIKCLEAVRNEVTLPDPNNFTPQVIESTLNKENVSFLPNQERGQLFTGKKFIFFSKRQFEMYKLVLTKASATPMLLSESKMSKSALCENNVIVIQYNISAASQETQEQRNMIQDIINYLKSKAKRVITDVEIGLAILYCSTEKYCNPDFHFPSEMIKQSDHNTKPTNVLAQESQEPNIKVQANRKNVIINETLSSSITGTENMNSSKRKNPDDDDIFQENSHKKFAMNKSDVNANCTNKRKVNEDTTDIEANPSKKLATLSEAESSQDTFNFVNKIGTTINNSQQESSSKRLNLAKPQKRKVDSEENEDDLFQFVKNKSKLQCNKSNMFESHNATLNIKQDVSENIPDNKVKPNDVDVATLRGAKLEELMEKNKNMLRNESMNVNSIKEELEDKMSDLDLGTTIVTIKKELIVKKEPVVVEKQSGLVKNFKKFKKVWPVKMQISIISKTPDSTDNRVQVTV